MDLLQSTGAPGSLISLHPRLGAVPALQRYTSEAPAHMDETKQTPEELIAQMSIDELQELLEELGFDTTGEQAAGIKDLIARLGSLEAAIDTLLQLDDAEDTVRRAA